MYKLLLTITLLVYSVLGYSQAKKAPFNYPNLQAAVGKGIYQKDSTIKAINVKIYVGSKGGRYYIVPDKNDSSLFIRKYLKKS